ncbi:MULTISPECIES: SRPBCC family protein [Mycolicibacterium]|uniref:Carbon monoxide dehydrogenase n=1 Tax=Mycolicibacterium mageritense TaxID=53462 RepID=A0AAI8TL13_MYCME|nr:SRPBCC family protein [Mycolicibacterium mageritense]BDY26673.1 hypothetical protein hbim_00588 [Mycolicibacterium mageritense]
MELTNEFRVPVGIDEAWELLTDVQRVAPCVPGAALTDVVGDEYRGIVKIKVGPVTVRYRGTAKFESLDQDTHTFVLVGSGKEAQGQGKFRATVRAELSSDSAETRVGLHTDLEISGRVAQFGRGVIADVADAIIGQFVTSLEELLLGDPAGERDEPVLQQTGAAVADAPSTGPHDEVAGIDVLGIARDSVGGRLRTTAVGAAVVAMIVVLLALVVRRSAAG